MLTLVTNTNVEETKWKTNVGKGGMAQQEEVRRTEHDACKVGLAALPPAGQLAVAVDASCVVPCMWQTPFSMLHHFNCFD